MSSISNTTAIQKSLRQLFHATGQHASADEQNFIIASRKFLKLMVTPLIEQMGLHAQTTEPVLSLDSACGPGVFTQEMQSLLSRDVLERSSFLCADKSPAMVDLVKKRVLAEDWVNVKAQVLDAMNTGCPENSFTHVAITLGLHLIPDPDAVLSDCQRILKPGGVLGATTFAEENSTMAWIPDMRSAFQSLPFDAPFPEKVPMQMHQSGKWTDSQWIQSHLQEKGFKRVESKAEEGSCQLEDADEFMSTFGMMIPFMMNWSWSEEMRKQHPPEEVKGLIKKHLEEKYGGKGWTIRWKLIRTVAVVEK